MVKSPNMISTTGRMPRNASPVETPVIAASLIGVFRTRPGNSMLKSRVILNAPP